MLHRTRISSPVNFTPRVVTQVHAARTGACFFIYSVREQFDHVNISTGRVNWLIKRKIYLAQEN